MQIARIRAFAVLFAALIAVLQVLAHDAAAAPHTVSKAADTELHQAHHQPGEAEELPENTDPRLRVRCDRHRVEDCADAPGTCKAPDRGAVHPAVPKVSFRPLSLHRLPVASNGERTAALQVFLC